MNNIILHKYQTIRHFLERYGRKNKIVNNVIIGGSFQVRVNIIIKLIKNFIMLFPFNICIITQISYIYLLLLK